MAVRKCSSRAEGQLTSDSASLWKSTGSIILRDTPRRSTPGDPGRRAPAHVEVQHGAQVRLEGDPDQGGGPSHVHHGLIHEYPAHIPQIRAEGSEDGTEPLHPPPYRRVAPHDYVSQGLGGVPEGHVHVRVIRINRVGHDRKGSPPPDLDWICGHCGPGGGLPSDLYSSIGRSPIGLMKHVPTCIRKVYKFRVQQYYDERVSQGSS